jgi:hypothetical protein
MKLLGHDWRDAKSWIVPPVAAIYSAAGQDSSF